MPDFPLIFAFGLVLSGMTVPAEAALLTYRYVGACAYNCDEEGLAEGAPATGRVVIDDAGRTPDGFFGNEALVDFRFDFGGIRLDKASAAAFSFGGPWEVTPGGPIAWHLDAGATDDRFDLGPTISVSGGPLDGFGYASALGTCEADEFGCSVRFRTAAQFELRVAPVPAPAAGWLALSALGGGLAVGMRRRASARAA